MKRILLAGVLVLGAACGSKKPDPVGPVAGDLIVSYAGPSQTDGALLLLVTGSVTAVRSTGGYQVASAPAGPTSTRVVVTGQLATGDILKLTVPDVAAVATYSVKVEGAADRSTFALGDLAAYSAQVRR